MTQPLPSVCRSVPALTPALQRYLYTTAAVTGAAVMIVEILGARMLSPYIGTSHFVWTAQIAVTLMALACGYYAGGRLVDRKQDLAVLYYAILGASLYLVATVKICESVATHCIDINLAVGSLLAATVLFFVPLALLAMTGPFLVRVITSSVADVGGNVGRLTAIGTFGSFIGTLLIGYVMLPLMANSHSMHLTALMLALAAGGYFACFARNHLVSFLALIAGAVLLLLVSSQSPTTHVKSVELFKGNSNFGEISIMDAIDGHARFYLNDNLIQNAYDPTSKQSIATFNYLLTGLGMAYTSEVHDVLCVGLGVGVVPMDFARLGARVDVVEINPAIVPVAQRFFDLDAAKINLTIDDGRHFLNDCKGKYDVVVLDAFLGDSSPSHLMTQEAFRSIQRVMRPGGTLVINLLAVFGQKHDFMASSLFATLQTVFPGVRVHSGHGQTFIAATNRPDPVFVHSPDMSIVHPRALAHVTEAYQTIVVPEPGRGIVLTDDFNPVEFFDASNREANRRLLNLFSRSL